MKSNLIFIEYARRLTYKSVECEDIVNDLIPSLSINNFNSPTFWNTVSTNTLILIALYVVAKTSIFKIELIEITARVWLCSWNLYIINC